MRFVPLLMVLSLQPAHAQPEGSGQSVAVQFLFSAANADRVAHGLSPLRFADSLTHAADQHARQMAAHRSISHQFAGEAELAERAGSAGAHFSLVTENVAEASNAAGIHDLWMQSAGHRANLLDPQVDAVGIAVVWRDGQFYAVEDFARTVPSLTLDQQERAVAKFIQAAGVSVSATTAEARKTCALTTGYAGARQPGFVMRYTAGNLDRLPEQLQTRLKSGKYHEAMIGACEADHTRPFSGFAIAVLLYP